MYSIKILGKKLKEIGFETASRKFYNQAIGDYVPSHRVVCGLSWTSKQLNNENPTT